VSLWFFLPQCRSTLNFQPSTSFNSSLPALDDWGKEWEKNSQRNAQPKLLPVDFRSPLGIVAQSN
jgi:hypothetical protein